MTVHLIHMHTQPIYTQHKAGAESKVRWPFSPSLATILNELDEWQVAPTLLPWQPQCSQLGQSQAMWIDDLLDAHTCLIVYIIHYCTYFQASTQYRIVFTVSILKGFQASHMIHCCTGIFLCCGWPVLIWIHTVCGGGMDEEKRENLTEMLWFIPTFYIDIESHIL